MAGKKKFKIDDVIKAIESGHTPKGASDILNCHPDTIRNYSKTNDKVRRALKSERENLIDMAEGGLRKHLLRNEAWAIAFTLKTIGKENGYTERTEHTGNDGKDIVIRVIYE